MKQKITFLTMLLAVLTITALSAQITPKISLQGILREASGLPVSDGNYDMTFKLYDVETGGTELWTEDHTAVPVSNGIYAVKLGSFEDLTTLAFNVPYFVGVTIDGTELSPRVELTYSPYSLRNIVLSGCTGAIGDIKYSILTPAQFQAENGDCWVPMDGGDITGKALATNYGWNTLPDMSGKFIRAHEYNDGSDPDRTPGDAVAQTQNWAMKDHTHNEVYGGIRINNGFGSVDLPPGSNGQELSPSAIATGNVKNISLSGPDSNVSPDNLSIDETRPVNMNFYVYIRVD